MREEVKVMTLWNVEKAAETETCSDTRSSLLRGFSI